MPKSTEKLSSIALEALKNAAENDETVPATAFAAAADMIEHGVFGPTEDCLDSDGRPFPRYVTAVAQAMTVRRMAAEVLAKTRR